MIWEILRALSYFPLQLLAILLLGIMGILAPWRER